MSHFFLSAIAAAVLSLSLQAAPKSYKLQSPSGDLQVEVSAGETLQWSISRQGVRVLEPSALAMVLDDGSAFGRDVKVKKAVRSSVDRVVKPLVYFQAEVPEVYNQLTLRCNGYSVEFRAYDDGAAYRFVAARKAPFTVVNEQAQFCFGGDYKGFIPYARKSQNSLECQFFTSCEALYTHTEMSQWESGRIAFLPVTLEAPQGMKVCITESGLVHYPGMYLWNEDKDNTLEAIFPPYPKEVVQGGHNLLQGVVNSREDYIAKAGSHEAFPWRIVIVAKEDKDLLTCHLPWLLGDAPSPEQDFSWVKPGKVAWDWWNAWNLYGVDFEAGINNQTYKYYIDFAAASGIEYVILDEGWAVNKQADLFQVVPEIDLPMLCRYAQERGVGLILWAGYWAFEKDMERACREYAAMGIKGFKVDFMDRDDQPMVDFYRRAAETAARYHLMIDFHGAFKPSGLHRTWPNVVNYEIRRVYSNSYSKYDKIGKAENFQNSGNYYIYALNSAGQLNELVGTQAVGAEGADITTHDINSSSDNQRSLYVPVINTLYNGDASRPNSYGCDIKSTSYPQVKVAITAQEKTPPFYGNGGDLMGYRVNLLITPTLPSADVSNINYVYYYRVWREIDGTVSPTRIEGERLLNRETMQSGQGIDPNTGNLTEWGSDYECLYTIYPTNDAVNVNDLFVDWAYEGSKDVKYIVRLYATTVPGQGGAPIDSHLMDVTDGGNGKDYFIAEAKITAKFNNGTPTSIGTVNAEAQVVGVTYYNMMGVASSRPFQGVNIVETRYSNGSKSINKTIF